MTDSNLPSPEQEMTDRKRVTPRMIAVPKSIVVAHPMRGAPKGDCSVILDEDGALWLQEPSGMTPLIVLKADRIRIFDDHWNSPTPSRAPEEMIERKSRSEIKREVIMGGGTMDDAWDEIKAYEGGGEKSPTPEDAPKDTPLAELLDACEARIEKDAYLDGRVDCATVWHELRSARSAIESAFSKLRRMIELRDVVIDNLKASSLSPEEAAQLVWKWVDWTGPNRYNAVVYESAIAKLRSLGTLE